MTPIEYVECVRIESARFRDAITADRLALDVPGCPGWSVLDLAHHVGEVQRWARLAAATGAPPQDSDIDSPPASPEITALHAWLADGADALCATLAAVPADAPTWHPFPVPKVAAVWPRRQAHEISIHRWDAQAAGGSTDPIDNPFATDFVREYFEVIVPRVIDRDGREAPAGRLAVSLTDSDASFVVTSTATDVALAHTVEPVDGSIEGTASDVILALWRRQSTGVSAEGELALRWLKFGGN